MKIYFAPMEGITDGILRRAHHDLFGGVDIYGLPFQKLTHTFSLTTRETRDTDPQENSGMNVLPQALTKDADQLIVWMKYIADLGYSCGNLNIGCPSPTVTKRGRGSGMLRDTAYLKAFLDAVLSAALPIPLSVKTRIGYENPEEWPAILEILSDYPFAHMTIHVRTMREQYTGGIHPEAFQIALQKAKMPLVYNGDLRTMEDIHSLAKKFPQTDGIMIGRGLLADPSLARQARGGAAATQEELERWYRTLYDGWTDRFHATLALGRVKKLMTWPCGDDIRRIRLLRRARTIEECIDAALL